MLAAAFFLALPAGPVQAGAAGGPEPAEGVLGSGVFSASAAAGPISIDVRQADIRDVLSALAIKNGASIIFAADPVAVSFRVENVAPGQALELLLQAEGLSYIREGNLIIVGKTETLQKDFFKQMILTRFNLLFIPADKLKPLIGELGIPLQSLTLEANPYAIWVQGTPQALSKMQELIQAVDRPESETSLEYRSLAVTQVTPLRMAALLNEVGLAPQRVVALNDRLLVFDRQLHARWPQVESLAKTLDTTQARENTVFVHQLRNISAADAASRLAAFGFEGVETQTFNYPEISREILVVCPPYMQAVVRSALADMDGTRLKIRVPVATTEGAHAHEAANAKRHLLSELSGVPVGSFHISRNLSGDTANPRYVLWVEESPEKIRQIEELSKKIE
jgi:type IV pilus assembly protein PilQ